MQRLTRLSMMLAMATYLALILGSVWLQGHHAAQGLAWRALLAPLLATPVIWVIRAVVRVIRDQDELERLIDLEAIAMGAGLTGFGFFSVGMLIGAEVLPPTAADMVAIWVLPSLFACFGPAKGLVVMRRYHHT